MKYGLLHTLEKLSTGQSLARVMMNIRLSREYISGKVVDVGGGRSPDYFHYIQQQLGVVVEPVDGILSGIDFEVDSLPYGDGTTDTVLMCNILEHIYNHQRLLKEAERILRKEGRLVGFVPFWVGYHPDPQDYFRYTKEALRRLLHEAGFSDIAVCEVGGGPFRANFNTLSLSMPRILRPLVYPLYALVDELVLMLRPKIRERYPLGYLFTARAC